MPFFTFDVYNQMRLLRLITICALALCLLSSSAQNLRVVKDIITCAYGIKNAEGDWVISAKYINLYTTNLGYFVAQDQDGVGLLVPDGSVLIEYQYGQIS